MKRRAFVATAALVLGFALPASAAGDFTTKLMGRAPGKGKTIACFNRVYDEAHLAAHPQQNVRAMMLMVSMSADEPDTLDLRVGTNFRSRKILFQSEGNCAKAEAGSASAHCAVACDGGSIDVALKDNGSVLLSIPDGARVWRPGAPDNDTERGAFAADDKLFRLDRAELNQCLPLAAYKEEKAILTRGQ
jgi:hypothetical protein